MSNLINLSIKESPKFRGAYEVHATYTDEVDGWDASLRSPPKTRTEVHPCHNYRTASDLCDRIEAAPPVPVVPSSDDLEQVCGCNTGGLGYTPAVTWLLTGRVYRSDFLGSESSNIPGSNLILRGLGLQG